MGLAVTIGSLMLGGAALMYIGAQHNQILAMQQMLDDVSAGNENVQSMTTEEIEAGEPLDDAVVKATMSLSAVDVWGCPPQCTVKKCPGPFVHPGKKFATACYT